MKQRSSGFTLVEVAILVAVAGTVGLVSWYVWQRQIGAPLTVPGLPTTAQASSPTEYARTASIPADWKTFTSPDYGLALSYPPTWTVSATSIPKTVGYDVQNVYSTDASKIYVVCYKPPGWQQSCATELNVNDQPFDKSVRQARAYYSRYLTDGSAKVEESRIVLDGHEAVAITTKQTDGAPSQRDYYIAANNGTYVLPTVYDTDPQDGGLKGVLSAQDSLRLFESVRITTKER